MPFADPLIPVVVGFLLGLLGGPIVDHFKNMQCAGRLRRMMSVELKSLDACLEDLLARLQAAAAAGLWYERSVTFTDGWFWTQPEALALLDAKVLGELVALRNLLRQLEADYRSIEQDAGADGRMFPREHILGSFDGMRQKIRGRTEEARKAVQRIASAK